MPVIQTRFLSIFYARPLTQPAPEWREIEQGPGPITLPEGEEYGFRLRNCSDEDLEEFIREVAGVEPFTYASLSENRKITDEGVELLKAFPRLTYLNLSSCSLTNEGMPALAALPRLETLDLSFCNRLTGPALKALRPLSRLQLLNLQGCVKIRHGDVARFNKQGLKIIS